MNATRPYPTKEDCAMKVKDYDNAIARLKEEFTQNRALIDAKVKGQIRTAQKRNREIKEEIAGLKANREIWANNGGVW